MFLLSTLHAAYLVQYLPIFSIMIHHKDLLLTRLGLDRTWKVSSLEYFPKIWISNLEPTKSQGSCSKTEDLTNTQNLTELRT